MFKLQRPTNRPSKQRERFDFKFSSFQALEVPKGWDRLFVSIVSVETGKTIAKLGKALVKNGSCHWTETISESIYISRHDSSKAYEDCLLKLVVSTGSTRSNNTLGEAAINLAQHTTSRASSAALSLPLKKCTYRSILQVKIQRATPRSTIGDEGSKNSASQEKAEDLESKSDSTGKPPLEDLATSSHPLKLDSQEPSESATVMINSFSSLEGSIGRETLSAFKSDEQRRVGGRSWADLLPDHYSVDEDSLSNQSPVDSRVNLRENSRDEAVVNRLHNMTNQGSSSRNLLEAAEDTIEELRAEAKMWERNARKLMIDLDISRKEFSDLSKKQAELGMELSAAYAEQDWLRSQVEKLKIELQESSENQYTQEDTVIKPNSLQEEMENEIKYHQDLNDDISQQLKRSQESNIELVSILQELEETIEQQRIEIEDLSSLKFMELQNSLTKNSEELEQHKADIQLLDEALRKKTNELEKEGGSSKEIMSQVEREYDCKVAFLEAKLSDYIKDDVNHIREIESLREKVVELEKDCSELTDENLELLCKLKESNKTVIGKCPSFSDESEVSDPKYQVSNLEEELKKDETEKAHFAELLEQMDIAFHLLMKSEARDDFPSVIVATEMSVEYVLSLLQELNKLLEKRIAKYDEVFRHHEIEINDRNAIISEARKEIEQISLEVQELERSKAKSEESYANLMRDLEEERSDIVHMETVLMSKEQEANFLSQQRQKLEAEVAKLELETTHLEQDLEVALREKRNIEELEMKRNEEENTLSRLREENTRLQECIFDLKAQVEQLQDEKRLYLQEMESHKSSAMSLKDELDIQLLDLKQKLEDIMNLKEENKVLLASAASSVLETAELKRENQQLHGKCSELVDQLSDMTKSLSDCTRKVESLQREKLAEEASSSEALLEKKAEFESLQIEVERLREQLYDAHREREVISVEASSEVLSLLAEKAELQTSLEEIQWEAESTKNKLDAALQESNQSQNRLMTEHERTLKLLANYRKCEERLKTELNDLELKHTISDYERQQLTEEMSILKGQLQSIPELQNEVSILKSELDECKLDRGKLEHALQTISADYEELKAESVSLSEKISVFEGAMSEFEEFKSNKLYLEEKVMQMEMDLKAREILCIENGDLRNEVTEMKRLNAQFQQKMYRLEEERDECLKKAQALEENLKLMEEERESIHIAEARNHDFHDQDSLVSGGDNKNEFLRESRSSRGGVVARERYERTKSSLETELRDLRERYLEMSLKYAEVEEQREGLVMKLKASSSGKRWF